MSPLHFLEPICDSCKESRHTHSYHVLTYHPILHHTPQQWVPEGNSTIFISNDLWHKLFCAKEFPLNMRIKVGALYDTYIYIHIINHMYMCKHRSTQCRCSLQTEAIWSNPSKDSKPSEFGRVHVIIIELLSCHTWYCAIVWIPSNKSG